MSISSLCGHCKEKLGKKDYKLQCDECELWFHKTCITIGDLQFENLKKGVGQWCCEVCSADASMISGKKSKKVTLEDKMRKLEVMETKYNQLLDKFDKVANENKVLKSELGDINEQVAALNNKFNNNTEEIMAEIKDKEHRARNIIIYNLN
ncbi:hypothetical protein HHI36_001066 [Cryptolaemus montrouzieri]|uniref:PHD-type domain-containing protein n=1 Tax=Cryptolaemus montrouzieri TaxID=559131 RepID=A0ABD2P6A7_9CUCU